MEPQLAPTVAGALFAPSAAIVSPWEFALAMAEVAVCNGVELYRSTPVTNIKKIDGGWQLTTPNGSFAARYVVNAAGLNAQAIHEMAAPHTFTLEPTRGEYYLLDKSEGNRVNHVIFQCPNENGKGVLVTPTVHGNLLVGPNAQPVAGDNTACTADGPCLCGGGGQVQCAGDPLWRVHPQLCRCARQRGYRGLRDRRSGRRAGLY